MAERRVNRERLFIANIHTMSSESDVYEFFASFCKVRSVSFVHNSRGCAFLEVMDDLDVRRALAANGQEFHGRRLIVERPRATRG
jgi:RNA recognition motif-containing protein